MRKVLSRSLLTVAATTGALAATVGYAQADAGAEGASSGSPGLLSGNTVEAPVNAPVNACGNSADAVGAMNPAFGNNCQNHSGSSHKSTEPRPQPPSSEAPAPQEKPSTAPEPQREPAREPVREPVREPAKEPVSEPAPVQDVDRAQETQVTGNDGHAGQASDAEMSRPELAETGGAGIGTAAALGGGLLVGGVVLYRRGARGRA